MIVWNNDDDATMVILRWKYLDTTMPIILWRYYDYNSVVSYYRHRGIIISPSWYRNIGMVLSYYRNDSNIMVASTEHRWQEYVGNFKINLPTPNVTPTPYIVLRPPLLLWSQTPPWCIQTGNQSSRAVQSPAPSWRTMKREPATCGHHVVSVTCVKSA